jgi:tagatose-1,6-bisphosphate aldolase non-catalytic subunit AgaZ/GatZ
VLEAAIGACAEADAPLMLAATLNQVDTDGGYTGMTPHDLVDVARRTADSLAWTGPLIVGLDHGGPWKKDAHRAEGWSEERAWNAALESLEACLDAGYDLLHLDPTYDPARDSARESDLPPGEIAERTVRLMRHAETYRARHNLALVAYEVGVEEVTEGDALARFAAFAEHFEALRQEHELPAPTFAVGDIGTTLDGEGFDTAQAKRLAELARTLGGAGLKGHYTDGVSDLAAYPAAGVAAANVGPGLAAVEYDALASLVQIERALHEGEPCGLGQALRSALVASGRWRKWLTEAEASRADAGGFDALSPERRRWLLRTGSRYVWSHPDVLEARACLTTNIDQIAREHPGLELPAGGAEGLVQQRLRAEIRRYLDAFGLVGFGAQWRAS